MRARCASFGQLIVLSSSLIAFTASAKEGDLSEYLFGQALTSEQVEKGCSFDPLKIASTDYAIKAIEGLGLQGVDVVYIGCPDADFKTGGGLRDLKTGRRTFVISYPTSTRGEILDRQEYIAPLVHELSHVRQIIEAGSLAALKQKQCIERIELGADFMAGFLFDNSLHNSDKQDFQLSLRLLGNYADNDHQSHGRPQDRAAAFRMGFYIASKQGIRRLDDAYVVFQDIEFARIASAYDLIKDRCK
ncbi:hypothetical protein G6L94_31030 [Agrobacterium rhizogenes]|uniref:hypothetical protein n=1 Tax=Rhizobium rhizogenes TaxID=359 RepID=UPI00080FFD11|nr:hypothetical protein [Rhizobium rhizogenes]OCJ17149.1 hypothetical protein A6U88_33590 [Agrobacterium sp. B131/95]OCJ27345.1 hypothetical protein A6U89_29705 [Agrobacterium sp. B133/95]NTI46629.1 hypothetical protein [Rhizobium rhizogenes]NTI52763.1 hypothetical protein [Rhizobium rhizogenes]NTI98136.1 hypothetical protein [Rhizobium rhizogenes]